MVCWDFIVELSMMHTHFDFSCVHACAFKMAKKGKGNKKLVLQEGEGSSVITDMSEN